MSDQKQSSLLSCANICWVIAVLLGFAAFKVALSRLGFGAFSSMIVGIAAFFLLGWVLSKFLCAGSSQNAEAAPAEVKKTAEVAAPASAAVADVVTKDVENTAAVKKAPAKTSPAEKATAKKPAAKEAAAKTTTAKKPAAKAAPAKKTAAKAASAKTTAAKKAPAKKASPEKAAPKAAEVSTDSSAVEKKPRTMKAPRKAGADDLKLLKGVGPKLEQTLNELGIYHYNQVSKWGSEEIAWVDARLKFKGRIERDGWIDQAKILADGGETEFSKRSKKT